MFDAFPDEALPLIEVSDDKNVLTINEDAANLLRRIECPICPVSVVGLYRTGKSSLLNFLHGGRCGFRVGPSVSRCTRGVWIYGRPTAVKLGDGTTVAVVLLDTEGVGGLEADSKYDTRIFALATLLSAGLVYNSLGSIDEHAIAQLSFVAQLSRHVRFSKPKEDGDDAGDEAEEDARRLGEVMPAFTWVLRDFALELVDERGDAITADEYLERSLRPQRGYEAAVLERNRVRHVLGAFFPRRKCRTLVRPVHDEDALQRVDLLEDDALRPEFRAGLDELKDALFAPEHVRPKEVRGAPLRGPAYVELASQFVDAVNGGGVPVVSSAWDHVSQTECAAASDEAVARYEASRSLTLPADEDKFSAAVASAERAALDAFDARALGDARSEKRALLSRKLASLTKAWRAENDRASEKACGAALDRLYMDVVFGALSPSNKAASTTATDVASALEAAWAELRERYASDATARGPARDRQLARCLAEKWPAAAHELARRLEQRGDAEMKEEHDKLVGARARLAELEGSAAARTKMLEDAQAALVSTQLEKARHEARCKAAQRNLDEVQKARGREKEARDADLARLELELQKTKNALSVARQKNDKFDKMGEDPARIDVKLQEPPANQPCSCVVA